MKENRKNRAEKFKTAYTSEKDVEVIPSHKDIFGETEDEREELVGAYCRVSTMSEAQAESYELQKAYYEEYVKKHPNWALVDVYADEGISATSMRRRKDFLRLMEDCKNGKLTMVITKSVSRFARNVVDAISCVRVLRNLPKPVGVYFETERINTLKRESDSQLSLLASFAESESLNKSVSVKWAIRSRFAHGLPRISALYGYCVEDRNLSVIPEQAEIIRTIAFLFLDGYTLTEISQHLRSLGIVSPTGRERWSLAELRYILQNEKYVGDVLMQKTVTIDVFTHRSVRNTGHERQYRIRDHHEPILPRDKWDAIQRKLGTAEMAQLLVKDVSVCCTDKQTGENMLFHAVV